VVVCEQLDLTCREDSIRQYLHIMKGVMRLNKQNYAQLLGLFRYLEYSLLTHFYILIRLISSPDLCKIYHRIVESESGMPMDEFPAARNRSNFPNC
jgi:hypothetical protein